MQTEVHEIAPGVHKLSTFISDAPPAGFGFNQYLIEADQPLLFHCGGRALFPLRFRRRGEGRSTGTSALDFVWPCGVRRERLDE